MHVSSTYRPQNQLLPQGNLSATVSYTFSAKERDSETGLSYFGARYYSSDLSIWLSVDPMSDKYPSLSPYVYCANNPVKLVDPNGDTLRFAEGVSQEFKEQFAAAIKKLNDHHLGGIASALEKSTIVYFIAESTKKANFNSSTRTIMWNPTMGLKVDGGAILSPTTVLNHEFAHALTYDVAVKNDKLKEWYADCAEGSDPDYGRKNEKWIITRTEQKTAKAFGEIKEDQVTRKNHSGQLVKTENSTSNKEFNK
jgi:RHS repeat-associated protein